MKKIISPFSSKSSSPVLPVATSEGKLGSRSNMGTESSRPSTTDVPMKDDGDEQTNLVERKLAQAAVGERVLEPIDKSFLQRVAKYTPLRLTEEERVLLGVVEGALDHSEFTSNVDVSASMHYVRETYDRDERVENEILEFCRVLLGLSAANDYGTKGKKTLGDNLVEREAFFQRCMEIGRRFKILNPGELPLTRLVALVRVVPFMERRFGANQLMCGLNGRPIHTSLLRPCETRTNAVIVQQDS